MADPWIQTPNKRFPETQQRITNALTRKRDGAFGQVAGQSAASALVTAAGIELPIATDVGQQGRIANFNCTYCHSVPAESVSLHCGNLARHSPRVNTEMSVCIGDINFELVLPVALFGFGRFLVAAIYLAIPHELPAIAEQNQAWRHDITSPGIGSDNQSAFRFAC